MEHDQNEPRNKSGSTSGQVTNSGGSTNKAKITLIPALFGRCQGKYGKRISLEVYVSRQSSRSKADFFAAESARSRNPAGTRT